MLLPSAFPCDRAQGMVSPPASPPKLSSPATFNIVSSCFSLQNLMASNNTDETNNTHIHIHNSNNQHHNSHAQQQQQSYFGGALPQTLPTPPMAHAPAPMKLRLRTRVPAAGEEARGIVKRRHKRTISSSITTSSSSSSSPPPSSDASDREAATPEPPSTPKRSRIAPERMPLGLARADFHNLAEPLSAGDAQQEESESSSSDWTAEDDRMLVELVLEKLKLSKSDWQDCARTLGKDRHAMSRRWKSLMVNDEVGLKRRKIHSTWR